MLGLSFLRKQYRGYFGPLYYRQYFKQPEFIGKKVIIIDKKLDSQIEEVSIKLAKRKIPQKKVHLNIYNIGTLIALFVLLIAFIICVHNGFLRLAETDSAGVWISASALIISIISIYNGIVINELPCKKYIYLYRVPSNIDINDIIYKFYNYKKHNHDVIIDNVDIINVRNKLYLKIYYH